MVSRVSYEAGGAGGATAQQVWEYATRKLTAYHTDSGATVDTLATASNLYPGAGDRFACTMSGGSFTRWQGYKTDWIDLWSFDVPKIVNSYQKATSGAGAQRFINESGSGVNYGYFWESVGASLIQPFKPAPGELVLEETPHWIITVPEKWLMEHKKDIEKDVDNIMGYERHREVLTKMGFKMPKKEVK